MNNFLNLGELISYQQQNFNNCKALNFKKNNQLLSFSNQQFAEQIQYFSCGLTKLGLKKNNTLAIYCYQNPIWLIADFATIIARGISVPIFHNIAEENLIYQIKDANIDFIFTDNPDIINIIHRHNLKLKIISYDFEHPDALEFTKLIEIGKESAKDNDNRLENLIAKINSQDIATIIYTSGSTGKPKGVKLTHLNLISQIKDCQQYFPFRGNEIALSFLPLAHIFERMVMCYYISSGISVYFVNDIKNIAIFLQEFKPNLMTCVPRVLEKVYAKIVQGVDNASLIKKFLGKKALKIALNKVPLSCDNPLLNKIIYKIFDHIIYKKFRQALGGNMEMIICGSASLASDLEKFYWNIGVKVYCGYGLTESSPVISANCPKYFKLATVGKPFPSVKVKIAEDKELLASGSNIMHSYHNLSDETALTIVDNYLKTGDLAEIDSEGFIKIIGRKKELFKTSYGKYVYPVLIEQKLIQELGFLLGAVVIAQNRQFVSALLFPDFEIIEKFKEKFNFKEDNHKFLQSQILLDFIESKIELINSKLDKWQQIKKFAIILKPISIASQEITPSMKIRRNIIEEKFVEEINKLYQTS